VLARPVLVGMAVDVQFLDHRLRLREYFRYRKTKSSALSQRV